MILLTFFTAFPELCLLVENVIPFLSAGVHRGADDHDPQGSLLPGTPRVQPPDECPHGEGIISMIIYIF